MFELFETKTKSVKNSVNSYY